MARTANLGKRVHHDFSNTHEGVWMAADERGKLGDP
jgi:hypothetical protein